MREFTREEMLEIARKCRLYIWDKKEHIARPPYINALSDRLYCGDIQGFPGHIRQFPWADNAQTADVVIQKYLRKFDCFLMIDTEGFNMVGRDINLDYNYRWHASWTTAVLEAVLVSGHDTRMEVVG